MCFYLFWSMFFHQKQRSNGLCVCTESLKCHMARSNNHHPSGFGLPFGASSFPSPPRKRACVARTDQVCWRCMNRTDLDVAKAGHRRSTANRRTAVVRVVKKHRPELGRREDATHRGSGRPHCSLCDFGRGWDDLGFDIIALLLCRWSTVDSHEAATHQVTLFGETAGADR